ncbi:MAG: hypothetical protein PVH37_19045 [Desulfobacterales bacterium]
MLLIYLFVCICLVNTAYCQDPAAQQTDHRNNNIAIQKEENTSENSDKSLWEKMKGRKSRDALLLGMWSIHLDGTGEYFGNGNNNDQNHLAGIQYYGLTAGTFLNSKDDRAYYTGLAREIYSHNYSKNTRFDIGYKFGLLFGYGDDLINVAGISVFAGAYFGISWKRAGLDIGLIPAGIITANFRFDIDNLVPRR